MKKALLALAVVMFSLAAVYYVKLSAESRADSAPATPLQADTSQQRTQAPPAAVPPASRNVRKDQQQKADVTSEPDALESYASLLPAAERGDASSQFRLFEILSGCASDYDYYFSKNGKLLEPEEARLRMEAFAPVDEYAVDIYRACHRLMEEQPSLVATAESWQKKALEQNHPRALTARAAELIAVASVENPAAGKTAPPNARRDARALLKKAVASRDPNVLWMLSELRPALGGSAEEANKERWALQLAACDHGLECGPDARWVKRYCRSDPAYLCPLDANAETMIRSKTGSDFEMIKMRAREINELIDAGRSAELVP
jgi:hypothetical protein